MAAAVTTNIHPTDALPFALAAPLGALPVEAAPPDPPLPLLPPPAPLSPPPAPAAFAPTVKMGTALPVNEVSNSPAPITQSAPPLPSNEQVSWIASSRHTVAPWTMVSVSVVVTPLTPTISWRKYVVAPSDDATPPMLTVAKAVTEGVLREVVGREVRLGKLKPDGRETLGMETLGIEVGTGRTRVTAAAPWNANTEKTREMVATDFMFDAFGGQGSGDGVLPPP
ncbi:hypothetical protein DFH07DRAFT_843556 [Mycena maculata]|uniref:Uncharacterized protein n=1 Tax=Mycena maculata TaxID=230809 RepID=A0AAD7I5M6_9AGAR|nr:hypothetical protein DFH07DRAFT_843556 [Mycena maculata]